MGMLLFVVAGLALLALPLVALLLWAWDRERQLRTRNEEQLVGAPGRR